MAVEYAGPERRKFKRLETPFFLLYRLEGDHNFEASKALGKNISGGGLKFEIENAVHPGTIISLEIYLQSYPIEDTIYSIPARAKVIWRSKKKNVSKEPGSNKYQIGLEFNKIKTEDRERIIEYVERAKR